MKQVEAILQQDRAWAGYALADLQPEFEAYCDWTIAQVEENGQPVDGLVLFFDLLDPTAIVTVGDAAAVEKALANATRPGKIYLNVRESHLPAVQKYYAFPDGTVVYNRMAFSTVGHTDIDHTDIQHTDDWNTDGVLRLGVHDEERMRALYRHGGPFTPGAFDTYQLKNGVFFGVEDDDGTLLSVGGTHIVAYDQGVAAIGNMYTNPQARGRGLAGSVLRSIITELRANQIETIILNVAQANPMAQRLYERHGFQVHCSYIEGIGILQGV